MTLPSQTGAAPARSAQKARTRQALLAAARGLIARGEEVTVTAAAAEAGISKATAYRYFSDPAALVVECGLDIDVAPYEAVVAGAADLRARLEAISLYFFDLACDREAEFRQLLARTLDDSLASPGGRARRGARRVTMYERALAEDGAVPPAERAALVRELSAATGAEVMIALFDVVGAGREEAREAVAGIAAAICDRRLPKG
ncbi:TetR family transcriptional regulator [Albimonas sp. CAU 1670]|uniref:TetR family transcriptional regulator n=1 Tax=Albimonas sp. CAU 1670 TaxID=3032599 RepID=UPI0023DAA68E|nr:TetR family transcriptional regulator [Albimonas sp. CAU 1670]MDF2231416.1 TetR family transcriptional regulator [Albimonas sp. CAU 1670]